MAIVAAAASFRNVVISSFRIKFTAEVLTPILKQPLMAMVWSALAKGNMSYVLLWIIEKKGPSSSPV